MNKNQVVLPKKNDKDAKVVMSKNKDSKIEDKKKVVDPYSKNSWTKNNVNKIKIIKSVEEYNSMELKRGGVLPFCFYDKKYYFLFGRDNKDLEVDVDEEKGFFTIFGGILKKKEESRDDKLLKELMIELQKEGLCEIEETTEETTKEETKTKEESNLDLTVRRFWESSHGMFGKLKILRDYIHENFDKLIVFYSPIYNGAVLFMPVDYTQQICKYYRLIYEYNKYAMRELVVNKSNFQMKKDMIEWFSFKEMSELKKYFSTKNDDVYSFIEAKEKI